MTDWDGEAEERWHVRRAHADLPREHSEREGCSLCECDDEQDDQIAAAEGDRVTIVTLDGLTPATVVRVWGSRALNVTVRTTDGRTFVRLAASVRRYGGDR